MKPQHSLFRVVGLLAGVVFLVCFLGCSNGRGDHRAHEETSGASEENEQPTSETNVADSSDDATPESPLMANPLERFLAPLRDLASEPVPDDEPASINTPPDSEPTTDEASRAAASDPFGPAGTTPPIAPSTLPTEPPPQAVAAAGSGPAAAESIDLLKLIDPRRHSWGRMWTWDGEALVSPRSFRAVLRIPTAPPSAYRWTIVAERIAGSHSLNLLITVGGTRTMVVLDGFDNHSSGLNLLDGRTADRNDTTRIGAIFRPRTPCTIVCVVGSSSVLVTCDGQTIVRWRGSASQLSLDSRFWGSLQQTGLALAVYHSQTQFRITQLELTPLDATSAEQLYAAAAPPVGRRPPSSHLAERGVGQSRPSRPPWRFGGPSRPGHPIRPPMPSRPRGSSPVPSNPLGASSPDRQTSPPEPQTLPGAGSTAASRLAKPIEPSEAALGRKESVCLVEHPFGTGTGFVVGENLVATNAHVVQDAYPEEIEVAFSSGGRATYRANRLLFKDSLRDLCLLEVPLDRPPIPMVADHPLQRGEKVVIIGNPALGETDVVLRDAVATGTITALVHTEGCDFYQVNATVNYGSSGGPVLNFDGEVVGVVAMKATQRGEREIHNALRTLDYGIAAHLQPAVTRGIAFAIPVSDLNKAIQQVQAQSDSAVQQVNDRHLAEVLFERLSILGGLYLLQLHANVPRAVRQQAEQIRFRHIPAATLRKMKLVELIPEHRAEALAAVLRSEEVQDIIRDCQRRLEEKVEHLHGSTHLDQATTSALESLLQAVTRTKGHVDNPPDTYQKFSRVVSSRESELKKLINQLSDQLAITDPAYSK